MTFWYGDNTSGWGWVLMILGMVAFWGFLGLGIALFMRTPGHRSQRSGHAPSASTPEQVLSERFASGEIDETEYTGRLGILHGQPKP